MTAPCTNSVATKTDVQALAASTKADVQALAGSTKADLRTAIIELKHDLTMRGIAGLIAAGGILFAALHLWSPRG